MALIATKQYLGIASCTVYAVHDGIEDKVPACTDTTVTLPGIEHPTTDIQQMGTMTISDTTRVENLAVTISCTPQQAAILSSGDGVKINWVQNVNNPNGTISIEGYSVYAYGQWASVAPGETLEVNGDGKGDLVLNCRRYVKMNSVTHETITSIDRAANQIVINGKDYRKAINQLL